MRCGDTIKADAKLCEANKALQKNGTSTCGVFVYAGILEIEVEFNAHQHTN